MRILHVIDELKLGGAQTHLETMLVTASKRHPAIQHRVVGLTDFGVIGKSIAERGFSVETLELGPSIRARRLDRVLTQTRQLIRRYRPDVVEAHLTWSRLIALLAARLEQVPVRIGYEHGDLYFTSPHFRIANFTLQYAAQRIVVCSAALGEWAHRTHRVERDRLWVLRCCVDLSRFTPTPVALESRSWGFTPETCVFVAVGSLGNGVNKRVDVCIEALAHARQHGTNAALVIAGDGAQRAELEQLSLRLGVSGHVRFLGNRSDVPELLRQCDVFCHAAPFEPFGIVCVEAMAAGLPTVVPDRGGMREAIAPDETGLLYEALNPTDMARAFARLASDAELRRKFGRAGRARVEQCFSAEAYVDTLYGEYAALLASN